MALSENSLGAVRRFKIRGYRLSAKSAMHRNIYGEELLNAQGDWHFLNHLAIAS